jgi:putative acetyltransferase
MVLDVMSIFLAHLLRKLKDFIPELDFVISHNNEIIGNIMYTKSYVINSNNKRIDTITFGPVSILPKYQKQGFGSKLILISAMLQQEP